MTYVHLTMKELTWIDHYYDLKTPVKIIATKLKRSLQTIYNVVNYLKSGGSVQEFYDRYKENKSRCGRKKKQLSNVEIDYIKEHEAKGWTPDVLCNHDSSLLTVSVKTLYRRYKEDERLSVKNLPMRGKRKPNHHMEKRGKDTGMLTLRDREKIFPNYENEEGHFEGDSIVGKAHKSRVITFAGRQSKAIITLKPKGSGADAVTKRIDEWLSSLPRHTVKSITFD